MQLFHYVFALTKNAINVKRFYELTNIDVYVILFKVRDSHISLSFPPTVILALPCGSSMERKVPQHNYSDLFS